MAEERADRPNSLNANSNYFRIMAGAGRSRSPCTCHDSASIRS
ncbi:hypothetical protein QUA33_22650 [Microcoleus sp. Pol14D4]